MSTTGSPSTLAESITDCNRSLDAALRRRFGVTLQTYKTLTALVQLVPTTFAFSVVSRGGDPSTAFALFTAILIGPEAVETSLATDAGDESA